MSDTTHRDLLYKQRYIHPHVGGKDDITNKERGVHIKEQLKVLDKKDGNIVTDVHNIPDVFAHVANTEQPQLIHSIQQRETLQKEHNGYLDKNGRYDPYKGHLYKQGLSDRDNIIRYNTTYIDINSKDRVKNPSSLVENIRTLKANPLTFTNGSNILSIVDTGHSFVKGDKIQLLNVSPKSVKLRTVSGSSRSIDFEDGSDYVTINYQHNIPENYNDTYLTVRISGIRGNTSLTRLNNIPINVINRKHTFLLTKNDNIYSPNRFYVKIPTEFSGTYTPSNNNIILEFNFIAGIPTKYINADYPVNTERLQGEHIITSTTSEGYTVELSKPSYLPTATSNLGGKTVTVGKITAVEPGYPNPNSYQIRFDKKLTGIVSIKMVSSEFPNSGRTVHSGNNKLYWQILNDGDNIYQTLITQGNYTVKNLLIALENAIRMTPRIENISSSEFNYSNFNNMKISIDDSTSIITFRGYKSADINNAINEVIPDIPLDSKDDTNTDNNYSIIIKHPLHDLETGDIITISGAIEHKGIPDTILNGEHTVVSVIDENYYKIELQEFNLLTTRHDTKGGNNVNILAPETIRLRFDKDDTVGELLGFRSPGEPTSITPFGKVVTNNDGYEDEEAVNQLGQTIQIENNAVFLSSNNYLLISCKQLSTMISTTKVEDVFAKIRLEGEYGHMSYDTYVATDISFYDPIDIDRLDFEIYDSYGDLYDFNGIDHSFTLEVVMVNETPTETGISSKTGKMN